MDSGLISGGRRRLFVGESDKTFEDFLRVVHVFLHRASGGISVAPFHCRRHSRARPENRIDSKNQLSCDCNFAKIPKVV